jgi:phosphonate transport system substrate-binding protein
MILFTGCEQKATKSYTPTYSSLNPNTNTQEYIFGIHPLHNPKRLFEVYGPLIDLINEKIPTIKLKLEASRNYDSFNKKLYSGHFDFALPNPYQTVESLKYGYDVFGKMGDDFNFRGIILVRKDSNIKNINDLKGKSISYPAPTALAATMLPQDFLYSKGIDIKKDLKNFYVGSQESSIMNVYLKKTDAASTWPPPWFAFIKERPDVAKEVQVQWETKSLPNNGLVYKIGVDKKIVEQIAQILFTLHETPQGRELLKRMELSKYEKASKETYAPVDEFLEHFSKNIRDFEDRS